MIRKLKKAAPDTSNTQVKGPFKSFLNREMEALKRLRPWSLTLSAAFLGALFSVSSPDFAFFAMVLYWLACIALWSFVVTEAFGFSKEERSGLNRWIARIFLVPLTLMVLSLPLYFSFYW